MNKKYIYSSLTAVSALTMLMSVSDNNYDSLNAYSNDVVYAAEVTDATPMTEVIPDTALQSAIASQQQKAVNAVTVSDLKGMERLEIDDASGVKSLDGLDKYATNLTGLIIGNPSEELDLKLIENLTKLDTFYIGNASRQVTKETPLFNSDRLKGILNKLPNIRYLNFSGLNLVDVSFLSDYENKNLQGLNLNNNSISDISGLKNFGERFPKISGYIPNGSNNKVADFSPIVGDKIYAGSVGGSGASPQYPEEDIYLPKTKSYQYDLTNPVTFFSVLQTYNDYQHYVFIPENQDYSQYQGNVPIKAQSSEYMKDISVLPGNVGVKADYAEGTNKKKITITGDNSFPQAIKVNFNEQQLEISGTLTYNFHWLDTTTQDVAIDQNSAFDPATGISFKDQDGNNVSYDKVKDNLTVDTSKLDITKPGDYEVGYTYGGQTKTIKVTVKGPNIPAPQPEPQPQPSTSQNSDSSEPTNYTQLNVKDSTVVQGEVFNPKDNFISAKNAQGQDVDFSGIEVSNLPDMTKPGTYQVVYKLGNYQVTSQVTVKPSQASIETNDFTLEVGHNWKPEDNFMSAKDEQGNKLTLDKLTVNSTVDTSEVGQYQVTYSYKGISKTATVNVIAGATTEVKTPTDSNSNQDSSVNTINNQKAAQNSLPQTGEKQSNLPVIVGLALSALGLIGLGYLKKRESKNN